MTKKEILKITLEDIRYWAKLGQKATRKQDILSAMYRCGALSSLLLTMGIITWEKNELLQKIYMKIINPYKDI